MAATVLPAALEDTIVRSALALAVALLAMTKLAGCSLAATPGPRSPERGAPGVTIWVLDHGWHTAIVARRSDVDRALWPEVDDFPEATFVEVAWGDGEFYRATSPTAWLAVKAALMGSTSVLHLVGFREPVAVSFAGSAAVELRLSRDGFDAMTRLIHAEYQRDRDDRPIRLERGLYGASWFYAARSPYHLFNTCNTWVIRMLGAAGLAVTPTGVITAGEAMRQVRRAAETRPAGAAPGP